MDSVKPKVLTPGMYAIDVEPIPPRNRNNREVHLDYLKHRKDSVETLREIVEEARIEKPLDSSLTSACLYTKQSQESLEYVIGTFPKDFNKRDKKIATTPLIRKKQVTSKEPCKTSTNNTQTHFKQHKVKKNSVHVIPFTGVNYSTEASGSQPRSNRKNNKILPAKSVNKKKKPEHVSSSVIVIIEKLSNTSQKPLTRYKRRNTQDKAISTSIPTTAETQTTDASVICRIDRPLVFGFRLLKTYDGESLTAYEFLEKVHRDRQFYDSDLEVAFRKHSCYVRNKDGVDLLKGSRGSNMYTISVEDMMKSSPIFLLSKASKNKSWLWHHRLIHLNFGTINDLARKDLLRGLPRLKFEKDHMCFACQLGKSKKYTHKPKSENTIMEVQHTLYMDLCEPMRVQSINGKKYILVIQKGVVKRQNQTLVEATRTMIIFSKALMFLWVEAVATVYDSEDLEKLKATTDIGIFVGYAPNRKGYRIYNKIT
ncbi:integrase, catalytic region, zinc finger, CCHC-type containing protein [Tanacetum coccineum]